MPPRFSISAARTLGVAGALAALLALTAFDQNAQAQNAGPIPYTKLNPPRRALSRPVPRPVAPPATAPLAPPTLDPIRLEAFVDGLVTSAMSQQHLAGATVAVVQNGQVVLKKGYGLDRLSPRRSVDPDRTLFRLGSISKTFTWIALQKEIEAGRMRLDAPINLYLPERLQIKDQGFRNPVRLRDLMTHTPGFEDRALGQLFERDWRRVRPLDVYLRQEQPRRVREPGTSVSYSNYGAALAGAAASNVQGKDFEQLIAEQILFPAGMSRTTFREPRPARAGLPAPMHPALAANLSQGFGWEGGAMAPRAFEHIGQIAPAGSASGTAADMARYMTLILNGGTLDGRTAYSPVVDRAIKTPLYRPAPGMAGWTAGFQDLPLPGGRRGIGHAGETLSFRANMVLVPSLNLGVFVAVNSEGGGALTQSLPVDVIRQMYGPAAAPPPSAPMSAQQLEGYAGRYLTTRRAYAGMEAFVERLIGRAQVSTTSDGRLITAIDGVEKAWLPGRQPGLFRAAQGDPAPLAFRLDANGRARALIAPWGGATFERQGLFDSLTLMGLLAAATAICALSTVGGLFLPTGAPMRQTLVQSRTALSQSLQAALWIIAMGCFTLWAMRADDRLRLVYEWPGGALITASACALVAAVLGLFNVLLLPIVWRGGRRVDSWTLGRKLRFTATALIFLAFSALVGRWGGLAPWVS